MGNWVICQNRVDQRSNVLEPTRKELDTFQGRWTVTGDKYYVDEDGYYIYGGRSDDMLKVGASMFRP